MYVCIYQPRSKFITEYEKTIYHNRFMTLKEEVRQLNLDVDMVCVCVCVCVSVLYFMWYSLALHSLSVSLCLPVSFYLSLSLFSHLPHLLSLSSLSLTHKNTHTRSHAYTHTQMSTTYRDLIQHKLMLQAGLKQHTQKIARLTATHLQQLRRYECVCQSSESDKQTDTHTDRQTERQTDRERERETQNERER